MYYSFAFEKEKNYKPTILKKGYEYIPIEYLSDTSIYGLLKSSRMVFDSARKEMRPDTSFVNEFVFLWDSDCTDGRYYMTVTPEQIYLYSSHENPNPNILDWVINVDSIVLKTLNTDYKKIKGLDCNKSDCYDNKYNEEKYIIDKNYSEYCEKLLLNQTKRLINKINKLLKDKKHKVDFNKRVGAGLLFYSYEHKYDVEVKILPITK